MGGGRLFCFAMQSRRRRKKAGRHPCGKAIGLGQTSHWRGRDGCGAVGGRRTRLRAIGRPCRFAWRSSDLQSAPSRHALFVREAGRRSCRNRAAFLCWALGWTPVTCRRVKRLSSVRLLHFHRHATLPIGLLRNRRTATPIIGGVSCSPFPFLSLRRISTPSNRR